MPAEGASSQPGGRRLPKRRRPLGEGENNEMEEDEEAQEKAYCRLRHRRFPRGGVVSVVCQRPPFGLLVVAHLVFNLRDAWKNKPVKMNNLGGAGGEDFTHDP